MVLTPGQTIDRFRIEGFVGQGGMGAVYKAYDLRLGRLVALKVLREGDDARLVQEARASAAIRHPNVVTVYDVEIIDGVPVIVLEWIDGQPLRRFIADASIGIAQRIDWIRQIARALAAAHAMGRVHRDVKPDNVLVASDGTLKLVDFGIAKRVTDDVPTHDGPASHATRDNVVRGTPGYMAPEHRAGAAPDGRADQWAWGVVAHELLSGVRPDTGPALPAGTPPSVAGVIARALSNAPNARFPSMDHLIAALDAPVVVHPTGATTAAAPMAKRRARAWWLLGFVPVLGGIGIAAAVFLLHRSTSTTASHVLDAPSSTPVATSTGSDASSVVTAAAPDASSPIALGGHTAQPAAHPHDAGHDANVKACAARKDCAFTEVCARGECLPCLGGLAGSESGCVRPCVDDHDCKAPELCKVVLGPKQTTSADYRDGYSYGCAVPCDTTACAPPTACHRIATPRGVSAVCLPPAK